MPRGRSHRSGLAMLRPIAGRRFPGAPARWRRKRRMRIKWRGSGSVTFLVLLAAAARAGIVAAGFLGGNGLLFIGGRPAAADELQLGHFLVFLALDIAREIFDYGLSGPAVLAITSIQRLC